MTKSIQCSELAVIVPMGDFPFFVNAVYKNIIETSGCEANIIFLVTKNPSVRLRKAFSDINVTFIETSVPSSGHGVHLQILDWAVENLSYKWICVQHADMFWLPNSQWLRIISEEIKNTNAVALTIPYELSHGEFQFKKHKFTLNGTPLIRTHDFFGVYNREELLDRKLKFIWGPLDKEIPGIKWIYQNKGLEIGDFLDGSDKIGLELSYDSKLIKEIDFPAGYIHAWDIFGLSSHIERKNTVIYINRPLEKTNRAIASYSWISSYLFDKSMKEKILPWRLVKNIVEEKNLVKKGILCDVLKNYKTNEESIFEERFGVYSIVFNDYTYSEIPHD